MTSDHRASREIDGKGRTVRELLAGRKYSIDYFQREYKWEKEQLAELIHDLVSKFLESHEEDIDHDRLDNDDKFMRHLAQVVRNGLGDRAGTCIDPSTQIVEGKTVWLVSCQRSPEPVFLRWKSMEGSPSGDFFVRSGPGTVKLPAESAAEYIRTRFSQPPKTSNA
jgi:hypothetical protein